MRWVVVGHSDDTDAAARCAEPGATVLLCPDQIAAHQLAFRSDDVLVVDEWTPETAAHVVRARRAAARVTVLAELIVERSPLPVLAVTGTAGKTTTTHLTASILQQGGMATAVAHARAGNAWPNAGLLGDEHGPAAWLAAELTSTHLCYMERWRGPDVAVVTCLWPDHVELHGSLEHYVRAKRAVMRGDGIAVLNADDAAGRALLGPHPSSRQVVEFSVRRPVECGVWTEAGLLRARWGGEEHAVGPAAAAPAQAHPAAVVAACAAALACGAHPAAIAPGLAAASALPHRMRRLGAVCGCPVIDDSLAATPRKAREALARYPDRSVVLLAGGHGETSGGPVHAHPAEEAEFAAWAGEIARAARMVVAFGPASERLAALPTGTRLVHAEDFSRAVETALRCLETGNTLLLSPAFPMPQADRAAFEHIVRSPA